MNPERRSGHPGTTLLSRTPPCASQRTTAPSTGPVAEVAPPSAASSTLRVSTPQCVPPSERTHRPPPRQSLDVEDARVGLAACDESTAVGERTPPGGPRRPPHPARRRHKAAARFKPLRERWSGADRSQSSLSGLA